MEQFKKFLGFIMLVVALLLGFVMVSLRTPFEFMENYVTKKWFLDLAEFVLEWGITALIVLGLSRMLAINNQGMVALTLILFIVFSVVIVMTLHYPEKFMDMLSKIGLK